MDFKTAPFPHQLDIFNKYKDAEILALNADMGIGKTKPVIDICAYKHLNGELNRMLVIAPNGVHAQWVDEQLTEHCPVPYIAHVYTSNKTLKYLRTQDAFLMRATHEKQLMVLAMNIEAFAQSSGPILAAQFLQNNREKCAVIVDEASIIKNPDIKTVKNVKRLIKDAPRSFRCTMTGTPVAKGPVNLWSIFDFLRSGYMGCAYVAFRATYTVLYKQKRRVNEGLVSFNAEMKQPLYDKIKAVIHKHTINGKISDHAIDTIRRRFGLSNNNFWHVARSDSFQPYKNLDRLYAKIKPDTYMIDKSDCLSLPPKIYKKEYFQLNKHQKQLIKQLEKYALAYYQGEELTLEVKALLGLRVLQICGGFFAHHTDIEGEYDVLPVEGKNAKLEYIKRDLEEVGNQQVIIWAVYTAEINLIYDTLRADHSVGKLNGEVTGQARLDTVNMFKSGKIQHLIAHPTVGGFGYNFQNSTVQYWYSRDYRTDKRIQAEDRIYRIGTTQSPVYKDLLYDIPWEDRVYNLVNDEKQLNSMFISHNAEELFKLKRK